MSARAHQPVLPAAFVRLSRAPGPCLRPSSLAWSLGTPAPCLLFTACCVDPRPVRAHPATCHPSPACVPAVAYSEPCVHNVLLCTAGLNHNSPNGPGSYNENEMKAFDYIIDSAGRVSVCTGHWFTHRVQSSMHRDCYSGAALLPVLMAAEHGCVRVLCTMHAHG